MKLASELIRKCDFLLFGTTIAASSQRIFGDWGIDSIGKVRLADLVATEFQCLAESCAYTWGHDLAWRDQHTDTHTHTHTHVSTGVATLGACRGFSSVFV